MYCLFKSSSEQLSYTFNNNKYHHPPTNNLYHYSHHHNYHPPSPSLSHHTNFHSRRKSHIVEAHVRAILIKERRTKEGEVIPLSQIDLKLGDGESEGRLFMVWPVIVEHCINEESPFWTWSAEDLKRKKFELVVVLEGIVESTGMTTQARTSYLPEEIMWGYRFDRLVTFEKETGQYLIDYSRFHYTAKIDIPKCSAKDLQNLQNDQSGESESSSEEEGGEEEIQYGNVYKTIDASPLHSGRVSRELKENYSDGNNPAKRLLHGVGVSKAALKAFDLEDDDYDDENSKISDEKVVELVPPQNPL